MVQLKDYIGGVVGSAAYVFQFLMVQLKVFRRSEIKCSTRISIPYGSIKR